MTVERRTLEEPVGTGLLDRWEVATEILESDGPEPALGEFLACWDLLPDPRTSWFVAGFDFPLSEVLARSIAETFVELGDAQQALHWARIRMTCPLNPIDTDPYVLLGRTQLDAGLAKDALASFRTAYSMGGARAFRERPTRYWEYFRDNR